MSLSRLNTTLKGRYGLAGDLEAQAAEADARALFDPGTRARLRFVARMAASRGSADALSDSELERAARETLADCGGGEREYDLPLWWPAGLGFLLLAFASGGLPSAFLTGFFAWFLFFSRDRDGLILRVLSPALMLLGTLYLFSHFSLLSLPALLLVAIGLWRGASRFHLRAVAMVALAALLFALAVTTVA